MADFLRHQLEVYFIENKAEAEKIADQVLINKRSRERSERERINIKKTLQSSNSMLDRVDKFVDCRSKDINERELFIVEGNSALTSCKLARDPEFQAIMPVRGKTLNCESSTYEKIFKNEIIINLLKVIGCGVEIKGKVKGDILPFNYDNFKWNKIIICTDADKDGYHIRTLILSMLNRLLPTLIKMGRVYIVESPLFEINTKNETFYAYTEREKLDIIAKIGDSKYTIQRSKGLGENSPEMMSLTTMSPATRRLIQITDIDEQIKANAFDLFLGDNAEARRAFIAENGAKYLDDLDLSDGD
jgi:DNA gyrase subunit B